MSNYPPGVTGREPEIAGYDDECDDCNGHGVVWHRGARVGIEDWSEECETCHGTGRLEEPDPYDQHPEPYDIAGDR